MTHTDKNSLTMSRRLLQYKWNNNFYFTCTSGSHKTFRKLSQKWERFASYSVTEKEKIDRGKRPSAFPFVESIRQYACKTMCHCRTLRIYFLTVYWITCSLAKDVVVSVVKAVTTYLMLPATPPSFASLSLRAESVLFVKHSRRNNVA